ncbi:Alanine--tRNA ligase [Trichinella spiralis]|uniref:Alanine--tRNA ligase n=1 Tax=Trichinella spiralis TaxID=6334 RepID=A0ABR3K5V2_TRISP
MSKEEEVRYRLVLSVECNDWQGKFTYQDFEILVNEAIKSILGLVNFIFHLSYLRRITDFDSSTKLGSIVVNKSDLNSIWAALCIYSVHFTKRVAIRVKKAFQLKTT